jgi:type II secretory ATPase GspE/PulE/Tfp pilus assembly ATPase PilB-like protein
LQEDRSLATVEQNSQPGLAVESRSGPSGPATTGPALQLDLKHREPEDVVPALIEFAANLHISDLFFNTDENKVEVAARHLGLLRHISDLTPEIGRRCISYIKTLAGMNISERRKPMDGRWLITRSSGGRLDLRIATMPTLHGEDLTLRILDQQRRLLSIDQLGLDRVLYNDLVQVLNSPSGLLLVTGPTETGKSTTLYACLAYLNNGERRISTIEDPVEYSIPNLRQTQVNLKLDLGFDELVRSVLRQAPHVIMIGEIRDPETAINAVRAATSGHLVLSTLHAPVAAEAIERMLRLGVHPHLLSSSLRAVIAQRLLRVLCPRCKMSVSLPSVSMFTEVKRWLESGQGDRLHGATGCRDCHGTGYASRTGVFEMMKVSPALRRCIDDGAPTEAVRNKALEEGMIEFRTSALLKIARGETSVEEVLRVLPAEYLSREPRPQERQA